MKRRADGRYGGKVKRADGTYKDIYGRTPEEYKDNKFQFEQEQRKGIVDSSSTVSQCATAWLNLKSGHVSYNRSDAYKNAVNTHILPNLGHYSIKEINKTHIQEYINTLSAKSNWLQDEILKALSQIFDFAIEKKYILCNPAKKIKKSGYESEEKEPLTDQQAETILKLVEGTRAELFVKIALYCGLRRGELLSLKWSDVNISGRVISVKTSIDFKNVTEKRTKSKAGVRKIPIPLKLVKSLCKADKSSAYVIPSASGSLCTHSAFIRLWDMVITRLQMPREKKPRGKAEDYKRMTKKERNENMLFHVTPHILRHTYCTSLYNAGVDLKTAQYLMGHSSIEITARIYTHLSQSNVNKAQNKLDEYFK